MKFRCGIILVLLVVVNYSAIGQSIHFDTISWESFYEKSVQEEKPIFVDVYTDWCGPCKRMEKEVFTNPEVAAYMNDRFMNYRVNAEKGSGIALAKRWKIKAYPTLIFFNRNGSIVQKSTGAKEKTGFLDMVQQMYEFMELGTINTSHLDADQLYDYLNRFSKLNRDHNEEELKRYWSLIDAQEKTSVKTLDLLLDYSKFITYEMLDTLIAHHNFNSFTDKGIRNRSKIDRKLIEDAQLASLSGDRDALEKAYEYRKKFYATLVIKTKTSTVLEKEYKSQLMEYYSRVKADSSYIILAKELLEQYILCYSVDEINTADEQASRLSPYGNKTRYNATLVSDRLKIISYAVFHKTEDKEILNQTKEWIEFSIELIPDGESYLIYAFILDTLGDKTNAKKAIVSSMEYPDFKNQSDKYAEILSKYVN
jgi:thioredoxin-related protein